MGHVEDGEELHGPLMGHPLPLPVAGQAEKALPHTVADVVVKAQLYVVLHGEVVEEADVLEGTGDARLVDLDGVHGVGVHSVQEDGAPGGLVDLGEQVKDGGLARAVGADEAGDLGAADGHIELVDGGEAAEVDAQVAALQDGAFVHVPFRDDVGGGDRHQLGGFPFRHDHYCAPPFSAAAGCFLNFPMVLSMSCLSMGLLVHSITRMRMMA